MSLKRKIKFDLEKRKRKGELITSNVPVRIRISINGKRLDLFSGFRVDFQDWDFEKQRVVHNTKNISGQVASEINITLNNFHNDLERFFLKCSAEDLIPSNDEVRNAFNAIKVKYGLAKENKVEEVTVKDFYGVFDEFISVSSRLRNWTKGTITKFMALKKHLYEYNKALAFSDLTDQGLSDILHYFIQQIELKNSTTKKHFSNLKWFMKYALEKQHTDNDAILRFKPRLVQPKKKIIFLTEEEIIQIQNTIIPPTKAYLEKVRDVLLFLCFSGIRYSDVYKLKKSDVKDGRFEVTTEKTADSLVIELNSTSEAILEKYKNTPFKNDKALPVISNQKMNVFLKELGEIAGIDEPITDVYYIGNKRHDITKPKYEYLTTHIGRRSFICLCISKGVPIQVIMKWTGHSDYDAMKPYIEVSSKTKKIEMQKLNF